MITLSAAFAAYAEHMASGDEVEFFAAETTDVGQVALPQDLHEVRLPHAGFSLRHCIKVARNSDGELRAYHSIVARARP